VPIPTISLDVARRIALGAQGFADRRPRGRVDARHYRRVLSRVGIIQLDSVNVVSRTHYLPFLARLGPYPAEKLDAWAHAGHELFEYWGHAASLLPVEVQPLLRWRMAGMRPWGGVKTLLREHPDYIESVYEEIVAHGPLRVGQLQEPGERLGSWWGWGEGKIALEWLFATGRITAIRDKNFHRLYDIPERALPAEVLAAPTPDPREAKRQLLLRSARQHGIGTAWDLSDYYRLGVKNGRPLLEELAEEGKLEKVRVRGWDDVAYRYPEATVPRRIEGAALLSPFDSLVWCRERVERLFDFHYRIEIYVPKPKRQYGYYVLPFLRDGELVGRVDLKADRKAGVLRVPAVWVEPGRDRAAVARAMAGELHAMAEFLGLGSVDVAGKGDLAAELRWVL
jgi:hypothetical protein